MWLSVLYLLLGILYAILWVRGFSAYLCLSDSCQYIASILGRPLLLWQMLYCTLSAVVIAVGWLKKKFKAVLTVLVVGVSGNLVLLLLAWRSTGYLCRTCIIFLVAEILLLILALRSKPEGTKGWFKSIVAVLTLVVIVLMVINPNYGTPTVFKPYSSQAEEAPAPLFDNGKMTVFTVDGETIQLDLRDRPILFWAWWCPYCTDDIANIKRLPNDQKPYLVITAIKNLDEDVQKSKEKLADLKVEDATIYIYDKERMVLLPTLFFWDEATETVRMH